MKKILIHFLACITVFVFWLNQDATPHDKLLIRNKWKSVFNDTSYISTADLPTWYKTNNPSVIWNEYIHSLKR